MVNRSQSFSILCLRNLPDPGISSLACPRYRGSQNNPSRRTQVGAFEAYDPHVSVHFVKSFRTCNCKIFQYTFLSKYLMEFQDFFSLCKIHQPAWLHKDVSTSENAMKHFVNKRYFKKSKTQSRGRFFVIDLTPKYLAIWSLLKMEQIEIMGILKNCFDWVLNDKGLAKMAI